MRHQRGIIEGPMLYLIIALAVVVLASGAAITVQTSRLNACKAEFESFKVQVKTLGEEAQRRADAKEAADKLNKEQIDAKTIQLAADLNAATLKLRDNSRRSFVSARTAPSGSPDLQCYDRTGFDAALRDFAEGVAGLVTEGAENSLKLKLAREWAQR
jgi:isopropylmalate/homocitrate/citramalate synthase